MGEGCISLKRVLTGGQQRSLRFFEGEKYLVVTGLLGFVLAFFCATIAWVNGEVVAPEGNMLKAFSFNAALGLFLLSTAAIVPFSGMGSKNRIFFRWSYISLAMYSYFAETVQNYRGVNPRFVAGGTNYDVAVGSIFTFVAFLLILFYLYLAVPFFRAKAYRLRPALVLGIRYAICAIMLSFAAGIWISVNEGRSVGLGGNIIWLHGLGFHALQAVPFVAWLTERRALRSSVNHRLIHLTGIFYVLGLLVIGWQTLLGHSIFAWTVLPLLAAFCFLLAFVPVILLLRNTKQLARIRSANEPSDKSLHGQ